MILARNSQLFTLTMCGRFTLRTPATVLIEHFDLDARGDRQLALFEARYNIAPTQEIVVVRADPPGASGVHPQRGRRSAATMRWGLVPSWSKGPASGTPMINARAESLAEKPAFRTAYRRRRCLIPADGFYEWQQSAAGPRGKKQPYYIHRRDGGLFAFAGLWEAWNGNASRDRPASDANQQPPTIESCTIVTTAANAELCELHDRMPVVLAPADYGLWLDPSVEDPARLQHLLQACPPEELIAEPVSTHVNRVANDDPRCIAVERGLFD